MKNVILITGNGFNYLISDIIKNIPHDKIPNNINIPVTDITTGISNITNLWQKFDKVFSDLKTKSRGNLNEEELIGMIHSVLDLFSNISGFEEILQPSQILQIQQIFDSLILTELKNISEEFRQYHDSEGYKAIKKLFPTFGKKFQNMLQEKCLNFNIYTTNYDGLLDTLLTDNPCGFIFRDCFSKKINDDFLTIEPKYLQNNRYILAHIHGSYLYQRYFGHTYKQKRASLNNSPIMVFNNPDLKKTVITNDNVLNLYYDKLKSDMGTFDKIIIIGNSMKTEPHIKSLIREHFSKRQNTEILVCSPTPSDIKKELEPYFSNSIIEINSTTIKTDMDLIAMIENNI